jgi:hypothetical protein
MKTKLITLALVTLTFNYANSQGLLGKLKDATKPKEPAKVEKKAVQIPDKADDFKDEFGYSGKYFSLDTLWYEKDQFDQKRDMDYALSLKWKFIREENGNVVNKLERWYGEQLMDAGYRFNLDEKSLEKNNIVIFKQDYGSNGNFFLVMLEKDVFGLAKVDYYKNVIIEYINSYAKDPAKLAAYDKETGAAKLQQILNKNKEGEIKVLRDKWMKNETYAKMIGKIGFIDQYSKVAYNRNDVTEKPDVFMSSVELGKQSIFYRAYYKTPGSVLCSGCELNTTYEIEGIKVSRVEQRKKSSKWSQNIKQKFVDDNFFTAAPTIVSFQENIADYAFLYCLYQNKDKFKEGKTFKMKVTISTNQEGVDKDVLAEGTLTLVYKDANKAGVDKMIKWIEDLLNE